MIEVIPFGSQKMGGAYKCDKPMVTISRNGMVTLNKKTMDLTGLKRGDMVLMCQGVENKKNWYIKKTDRDGFVLRKTYGNTDYGSAIFISKFLTERILISLNKAKSLKLPVVEKQMEDGLWLIDTTKE